MVRDLEGLSGRGSRGTDNTDSGGKVYVPCIEPCRVPHGVATVASNGFLNLHPSQSPFITKHILSWSAKLTGTLFHPPLPSPPPSLPLLKAELIQVQVVVRAGAHKWTPYNKPKREVGSSLLPSGYVGMEQLGKVLKVRARGREGGREGGQVHGVGEGLRHMKEVIEVQ